MSRVSDERLQNVASKDLYTFGTYESKHMARELRAAREFIASARKSKLMNERTKKALAAYDATEERG